MQINCSLPLLSITPFTHFSFLPPEQGCSLLKLHFFAYLMVFTLPSSVCSRVENLFPTWLPSFLGCHVLPHLCSLQKLSCYMWSCYLIKGMNWIINMLHLLVLWTLLKIHHPGTFRAWWFVMQKSVFKFRNLSPEVAPQPDIICKRFWFGDLHPGCLPSGTVWRPKDSSICKSPIPHPESLVLCYEL